MQFVILLILLIYFFNLGERELSKRGDVIFPLRPIATQSSVEYLKQLLDVDKQDEEKQSELIRVSAVHVFKNTNFFIIKNPVNTLTKSLLLLLLYFSFDFLADDGLWI